MDIYKFLTNASAHKVLKTFYNLDYDVRAIIKYLPYDNQHDLYYKSETVYKDIKIKYLRGKIFTLKSGRLNYSFYDIAQFYGGSLNNNAIKYLNSKKGDFDASNITYDTFIFRLCELIRYCIQDCKLTRDLTYIQANKFKELGISFYRPISKANMSERYVVNNVKIPRPVKNIINEYAFNAYYGGRFELTKRGYFDHVYCYDINSAYPNIIKDLPNPFDCMLYNIEEYTDNIDIAYYHIILEDAYNKHISPITHSYKGINVFPNSERIELYVSQPEMEFIHKHTNYNYEIIKGYALHSTTDIKPFNFVEDLYKLRKEIEEDDPVFAKTIKILMNSLYGKFWQVTPILKDITDVLKENGFDTLDYDYMFSDENIFRLYKKEYKAGYFFNPVFAAHITASTRMQLLNSCKGYFKDVIGFHTDSIITTKPKIKTGTKLGQWSLDLEGEGVFLGTGVYTIKNDNEVKHKRRGGTSKNITSWFELLKDNLASDKITMPITHVVTLGDIFQFPKMFNIDDLNHFTTLKRTITVENDIKRIWDREPTNFSELLYDNISSVPLEI